MTPAQLQDAIERYSNGFSMEEIGGRMGRGEGYVRKALAKAGVKRRGFGGAQTSPLVTPEIVDKARAMLTWDDPIAEAIRIACELDVPRMALRKAMGLAPRDFRARDPALSLPLGELPPDHPLAAVDAAILAARKHPHRASPWPAQSSLALIG